MRRRRYIQVGESYRQEKSIDVKKAIDEMKRVIGKQKKVIRKDRVIDKWMRV